MYAKRSLAVSVAVLALGIGACGSNIDKAADNFKRDTDQLAACGAKVDKKYSWTSDKSVSEKMKCMDQFDKAP